MIIDGDRVESEKYYNFTEMAAQLNEIEEGVSPSDSRKRPDQRLMEDGHWDEANEEKLRLEEKQRSARKQREIDAELAVQEGTLSFPIHFDSSSFRFLLTLKPFVVNISACWVKMFA